MVLRLIAAISAFCIVAVWLVYPLTIALLATLSRRSRATRRRSGSGANPGAPSVSIVIASRDDPAVVRERVTDCLRTDYGPAMLEVVVGLDARGEPAWREQPSDSTRLTVVRGDAPGGKAATLNAAVRAARGELLVFTDVQQRFEPNAIARLASAFDDPRVGAASGRLELGSAARRSPVGRYWTYERWLRRNEAEVHSCVGVTGAIWALRRALWSPLPAHLILDDVYTPMRVVLAGHRVAFVDDARAVDVRRTEPSQEYRRKVRTLTGNLQLCAWLPALLLPLRNPIWAQFMLHKLLRLLTPYWLLAIAAWLAVAALRRAEAHPTAAAVLVLCVAGAALIARARVFPLVQRMATWGLTLQAAVIVAALNGFRRRWDVWRA
jgi:cellulose synthase/poly-beta-1,6-N-acetylglucosamine synthase-like glycosyltransferase